MSATHAWTTRDVVTVSGPDAATYLQGQLSQDVAGLVVGASAPSFVLAPQGKVDGWGRVHRTADDAFEIDADAGAGAAWVARLTRFLLRTKAEISLAEGVRTLAVRGVAAPAELTGALPLPGAAVGYDLIDPGDDAVAVAVADTTEVEAAVQEADRIRAGVPAWGAEIDDDTIPATLGQWVIDASVSFTKGCYTGQELVARIDSRGGNVPRRLVAVELDADATVAAGGAVVVDGAEVGTVTSSAPGIALAFVARAVEVGADGVDAVVDGMAACLVPAPVRSTTAEPAAG